MSEAIFTEVIDVELNSGPLEESLTSLIAMYQGKLQELSGSGLDANAIGGLNIGAISEDLNTVRSELKGLTDAFLDGFGQIAAASGETGKATSASIGAALADVDAKASASTKVQLENLSLIASGSQEAWGAFAQAAQTALTDGFDPRVKMTADLTNNLYTLIAEGGRPAFEALTAQQQDWFLGFQSALAKVEDALIRSAVEGTDEWQIQQQRQVAMVEQATNLMIADFKKRADASAFTDVTSDEFQRGQQKQVAIVEEATRLMAADFAKRSALANDVTVEGSDKWQQAQMKQVAAVEQATNLMEADFKKRAVLANDVSVEGTDAWQQAQMRQVAVVQEATRLMEADFAKRAAAAQAAAEAQAKADNPLGYLLESHLAQQVLSLGTMIVEWAAIGELIDLAGKAVSTFVGFFKDGVAYLEDLETRSAALQGILSSNVIFSHDQAENFRLAGVAAENMNKQIQDYSIKYGIGIDILTRSFKSFVDSGGVTLVHGVDEALQASTLLSVAIKAAGADAETTRAALSEIPKLLNGTITPTSKILETLGLTTVQWKAMLAEAKNQGDLLDQLKSKLSNYLAVAEDSANRFGAIKETLGLMYDRTAGLAAQQFWPELKQDLIEIKQYLSDNKDKIDACAIAIGQFIKEGLGVVNVKTALDGVLATARTLATILIRVHEQAAMFGSDAKIIGVFADALDTTNMKQFENSGKSKLDVLAARLGSAMESYKSISATADEQIAELNKPFSQYLNAANLNGAGSPPVLGGKLTGNGKTAKPNKEAINELKNEYQSLFDANKAASEAAKQQIALDLASRLISIQTAAERTAKAAQDEYVAQTALIALYKKKGQAVVAPALAKISFDGSLDKQQNSLDQSNDKLQNDEKIKGITDQLKIQDQAYAQQEAAAKKSASDQLQIIRAQVKAGLQTVSAGLAEELIVLRTSYEEQSDILVAEYAQAGQNTEMKAAVLAKLSAEEDKYTADVKANASARTSAILAENTQLLDVLIKQAQAHLAVAVASKQENVNIGESVADRLNRTVAIAKAELTLAQETLVAAEAELFYAKASGVTGKELDTLIKKTLTLEEARNKAKSTVRKDETAVVDSSPIVPALQQSYTAWNALFSDFSDSNKSWTDNLKGVSADLTSTMNTAAAAIGSASKIVTNVFDAIQKGGALAGIGAGLGAGGSVLSSASSAVAKATEEGGSLVGKLSSSMQGLFANAGVVGSLASAAGGLISIISNLFTASAKAIAAGIKKAFDATIASYNNGTSTLAATIAAVKAQEAAAISQLSNQKGGQAQLNNLLPQFEAELAQLEQAQKQIITNFNTALESLQLHSTVLQQTLATWNQINASIKTYIDAGGDAATAAAFLSASLQQLKTDAANNLADGDKAAITQALAYNALLVQRQALTDAYNKSKFDTLNADALERRASNAVSVGQTQAAADKTYQASLKDLNNQISQAATEVSMYQQIYQLSSDTASLNAAASALQIASLAQQLQTLKDYQKVYNSIYQNPNGTYGTNNGAGSGGAATAAVTTIGQLSLNINTTGPIDAKTLANTIQSELQRSGRYGVGSTYSTTH